MGKNYLDLARAALHDQESRDLFEALELVVERVSIWALATQEGLQDGVEVVKTFDWLLGSQTIAAPSCVVLARVAKEASLAGSEDHAAYVAGSVGILASMVRSEEDAKKAFAYLFGIQERLEEIARDEAPITHNPFAPHEGEA